MNQSLRRRLIVLIALLCVASVAASVLMFGLFKQSAAAQAGQAAAEIARACDAITSTYRFYSANWQGPASSLQDAALQTELSTVVRTALRDRAGIEGGLWQAQAGSIAYAYPTYQGEAPKTDFPITELKRIAAINDAALAADRQVGNHYAAKSQVLLLTACPLAGPIPALTAWTMTRVVTFAGQAYRQLMAGLGVLLATVIVAASLLVRMTLVWSRHVAEIERALQSTDVARLPTLKPTGEKELDQIVASLNLAGRRVAEASERADRLAQQVAGGERLAAIGRVAAGVAHEIRNPIAAMRLKAENALCGDATRKEDALSMILGQIERLDRLLKRLLSLTERDPPQRAAADVNALVEACMRDHGELAQTKRVRLVAKVQAGAASIDAEQMRRALDNLVLNAIDAAPANSQIVISAEHRGEQLILTVQDEGPGPPAMIRDHLFEPFVTARPEGTGLGLSVVREIATAHGGTARWVDTPAGTTFEIAVPWV